MKNIKYGLAQANHDLSTILSDNSSQTIENTKQLTQKLNYLQKIKDELLRMKDGSVALIHQITTISKQRIYDPKNSTDILARIRLSDQTLNSIDDKIIKMYTKK